MTKSFPRIPHALITLFWTLFALSLVAAVLAIFAQYFGYVSILQRMGADPFRPMEILRYLLFLGINNLLWAVLLALPFIWMWFSRSFEGLAIIGRVLKRSFWFALAVSLVLAVLMCFPMAAFYVKIGLMTAARYLDFLIPMQILSPLMTVISFGLTNLWWALLLAVPFVRMVGRAPFKGLAISVVAYVAILMIPPHIIKFQSDRMQAKARGEAVMVQAIGPVNSVTVNADNCNMLCEQLLLGGAVTTVRVLAPSDDTDPHLKYQRLPAEECQELDNDFPIEAPCLLARLDDGAPSDLAFERERQGSVAMSRDDVGFSPYILMRERINLKRLGADAPLASQVRLIWAEPRGYVPLHANTGFDGNGFHGSGLVPTQRRHKDSDLDPVTLLRDVGVPVAERRGDIAVMKYKGSASTLNGYPELVPYDFALFQSMQALGGAKDLSRW